MTKDGFTVARSTMAPTQGALLPRRGPFNKSFYASKGITWCTPLVFILSKLEMGILRKRHTLLYDKCQIVTIGAYSSSFKGQGAYSSSFKGQNCVLAFLAMALDQYLRTPP